MIHSYFVLYKQWLEWLEGRFAALCLSILWSVISCHWWSSSTYEGKSLECLKMTIFLSKFVHFNTEYMCILIGCFLWSIRVQAIKWLMSQRIFLFLLGVHFWKCLRGYFSLSKKWPPKRKAKKPSWNNVASRIHKHT